MNRVEIDGRTFTFDGPTSFVAYHCAVEIADWNLSLARSGDPDPVWLAGTIAPGPFVHPDDLDGARVEIDPRSLDDLFERLLDRPVTIYPIVESDPAATHLSFTVARTAAGVALSCRFELEHDLALDSFPGRPKRLTAALDLEASIEALHPARLPASP